MVNLCCLHVDINKSYVIMTVSHVVIMYLQGRSQELEMGGAKLLGEGSGGR